MCGIAGCVAAPGEHPDTEALARMADALSHRGPDDRGMETWENVGLVNTRLAIVDLGSSGHQPIEDHSRRWMLTYNGEVYNHTELRALISGCRWRGHSDTETLVEALAVWGPDAVQRCTGPFALAGLDRESRRLVLARDRFGKKPLYVARRHGCVWFASEIRALLAAGIPAQPRLQVLSHAIAWGWPWGRETPLAEIDRLPQGSMLLIDIDTLGSSERRWYEPAQAVDPQLAQDLAATPRRRLSDMLERSLRDSVRSRLMADVPVGTMCSGGLDSSLLTALAREEHPRVVAFNCSLVDEPEADEGRQGELVAAALGVELETVRITTQEWRGALVAAVGFHEYPLHNPGSLPISLIAERARRRRVKVLLTGEGADELFGGYMNHAAFHDFLPRYVRFYRVASAFIRRDRLAIREFRSRHRDPTGRHMRPLEPADEPVRVQREVTERAARAYSHHSGARAELEGGLLGDLSLHAFPFLLNRMDKDAMAHSVETRLPFLDPKVVSLALNLPLEARVQPRMKGILRDVGRRNLPGWTARRVKYPGMGHFDAGRRIEERARPEFLQDGALRDLLHVSDDVWRQLISPPNSRAAVRLWSGEIWARLFVAGESPGRVEEDLWGSGGP